MNSLVFNTTANELRAGVYGYNQSTEALQLLQLNTDGELLIAGDFSLSGDITIANSVLTVFVEGNLFTANVQELEGVTSTGIALAATDISQMRTSTMFVDNTDDNPITVTLQLSPDGTTYFNDPNYTNVVVDANSSQIIAVGIFAQYAQLEYDPGALATFSVYFNAQA
ncbi:MAG: DUF6385 domain-containing protein [Defluviitaleaceae bacterium]|nr:DUF6385 domain-containing protein [Defluviitaleaceae bacterium]MCL2263021.1 DUF6385 domain-containing protein [Defluviitaleaceae bacterium]